MAEEFEQILDECINRLLQGESLEQCLQRYPAQAKQLEPLLQTALDVQEASAVEPRPEFKAQAKRQMRSLLHTKKQKRQPARLPFFGWMPRWATAVAIALFIVILAGGGTVTASSNSLPGDFLYPVKLGRENIQLALTFSELGKARLHSEFASRRADEMANLMGRGDFMRIEGLSDRFDARMQRIEDFAARFRQDGPLNEARADEFKQRLRQGAANDMIMLEEVERRAPQYMRMAIAHARMRLSGAYEEALQAFNGEAD